MRTGHIAFHISTRNGPAAVADLLRRTKCTELLVSADEHMSGIVSEALQELEGVRVHRLLTYDDLFFAGQDHDVAVGIAATPRDMFGPAILLHSSGTESHRLRRACLTSKT